MGLSAVDEGIRCGIEAEVVLEDIVVIEPRVDEVGVEIVLARMELILAVDGTDTTHV